MTDFRQVAISVTNRRYVPTFDTSSLGCRMNVNYLTIWLWKWCDFIPKYPCGTLVATLCREPGANGARARDACLACYSARIIRGFGLWTKV